jgi:hypothetical protein
VIGASLSVVETMTVKLVDLKWSKILGNSPLKPYILSTVTVIVMSSIVAGIDTGLEGRGS